MCPQTKQNALPGRAPPERASEFVLRLQLCLRWARDYAYPGSMFEPPQEDLRSRKGDCPPFPSSGLKVLMLYLLSRVVSLLNLDSDSRIEFLYLQIPSVLGRLPPIHFLGDGQALRKPQIHPVPAGKTALR